MAECDFYGIPPDKVVTKAHLEERHGLHLLQGDWHGSRSTCRRGEIAMDILKKKKKNEKHKHSILGIPW